MKKENLDISACEGIRVEFFGDRQVFVDGCNAILEYEPETVKLDLGKYNIRINGSGMRLVSLCDRSIMIEGVMYGLEFRC